MIFLVIIHREVCSSSEFKGPGHKDEFQLTKLKSSLEFYNITKISNGCLWQSHFYPQNTHLLPQVKKFLPEPGVTPAATEGTRIWEGGGIVKDLLPPRRAENKLKVHFFNLKMQPCALVKSVLLVVTAKPPNASGLKQMNTFLALTKSKIYSYVLAVVHIRSKVSTNKVSDLCEANYESVTIKW